MLALASIPGKQSIKGNSGWSTSSHLIFYFLGRAAQGVFVF